MSGLKQEIEVILFWQSQPLALAKLADLLTANPKEVKKALMDLVREYELRDGGLQINFRQNGYVLEPKDEFLHLADHFVPLDLKTGALRTLATIALKEPVKQTEIIQIRGSSAYEHIRELHEKSWIKKEPDANTFILKTSANFKKHFRLSDTGGELKEQLQAIFAKINQQSTSTEELREEQLSQA
jgi:segregation and condensation protein B